MREEKVIMEFPEQAEKILAANAQVCDTSPRQPTLDCLPNLCNMQQFSE